MVAQFLDRLGRLEVLCRITQPEHGPLVHAVFPTEGSGNTFVAGELRRGVHLQGWIRAGRDAETTLDVVAMQTCQPGRARAGAGCEAVGGHAAAGSGEEFSVCVTVIVRIPLLPEVTDADTASRWFVVEGDRYVNR